MSSQKEAAEAAVRAGVDIDMMSPAYMFHLEELVKEGSIPTSLIDKSAWNVLVMKNRLGLFENPFAGMQGEEPLSAEAKKTALALACESSVLLKNDDMLPLKPERKVFWGGPYVESRELLSRWAINCVTGDYSMLIETLFETTAQLDHFINELQQFGRTKTQIVFSTSVEQREVPVVMEEK